MSVLSAIPVIGAVVDKVLGIIDKAVTDKDLAQKLKQEVQLNLMTMDHEEITRLIDARAQVLVAEIKGESSLQRNWRPILMLTIVAIVANNYLVAPIINSMFGSLMATPIPVLTLPEALWNLMTVGTGGYIVGRSAEKFARAWKEKE